MAANQTTFKKGEGGRPKGALNKTAKQIKELLTEIVSIEFESLSERMNQLSDKERLEILVKLLPYLLPKCQQDNSLLATMHVNPKLPKWML
nr:hypothetical protein [Saprospiraceae bacterium]